MLSIIPAVDVLNGAVVRLMHGSYDEVTVYSDDPVAMCRQWMDQGAELIHVVDLNGARTGDSDESLWDRLANAGIEFQLGGGIRSADLAERALSAGASRVVLGTAAVWEPALLAQIAQIDRVVAAVDVRAGRATGAGWLDDGRDLPSVLTDLEAVGVRRLLVTGIDKDGTMDGPSLELLEQVKQRDAFSIIASGGVGDLADLDALAELGLEAVVVGRALYEGRFDVAEAMSHVRR